MKNKVYNEFACVAAFADGKTEYCEIRTETTNPERDYVTYWHSEHPMGTAIANFLYADLSLLADHLKQCEDDSAAGMDMAKYWLRESAMFAPLAAAMERSKRKKEDLHQVADILPQLQEALREIAAECLDTDQTEGMMERYLMQRGRFPILEYGKLYLEPGVKVKGAIPFPYDDLANFVPTQETPETFAAETIHTDSAQDLAYFLLSRCLQANVRFRKCKYCGRYFPIQGGTRAEYCDRLIEGSTKTCKEMGYTKLYEKTLFENPANKEYKRAYKTRNARIRRGIMTREEFNAWAEAARQKRDQCLAGEITLEELVAWLDKDKQK